MVLPRVPASPHKLRAEMTITPTPALLNVASTQPIQGRPRPQARPQAPAPTPDLAKPATAQRAKAPQNVPSSGDAKPPPVNVPRGTFLDIIV